MTQNKKEPRKRTVVGERSKLSSWHFANQDSQLYDIKDTNALADEYIRIREENPEKAKELAEQLICSFNNYLMKYVRLLTTGAVSSDESNARMSKDTMRFLSAFSSGNSSRENLLATARRLPNAFLHMNADDVYNELVIIFLDLLNKFWGKGGFTGFIDYRFGWGVKTRLFKEQRNPLNYRPMYNDTPEEVEIAEPEDQDDVLIYNSNGLKDLDENNTYYLVEREIIIPKLTPKFISEAPEPFNILWDKMQRSIIVMKFQEDLSNSAISNRLGLNGASDIKRRLHEAIQIYKDYIKKDNI